MLQKFQKDDIIGYPNWEEHIEWPRFVYLFKIIDIEYYENTLGQTTIIQYRYKEWCYKTFKWFKPNMDFFQSNSSIEKELVSIDKLYLLIKYGII